MGYIDLVNTRQGSKSVHTFSNGNTLPLVQLPFGMNAFCPQTVNDFRWYFHPEARSVFGIRLTHQPSPWIGDWGMMLFSPFYGNTDVQFEDMWSGYRPENAVFRPDYLRLRLLRYRADFELTPTERGAAVRVDFDCDDDNYMFFRSVKGKCGFRFDKDKCTLYAYADYDGSMAAGFRNYIAVKFSPGQVDVDRIKLFCDNTFTDADSVDGEQSGIFIGIDSKHADISLASSFISFEQAELNLQNELEGRSFDGIKAEAEKLWEEKLSKIEIKTDSEKMKTFCSCMYRFFLYPHKCYEIDKNGDTVHYSPYDGSVKKGYRYTDNGFWDTYRTVYPMLSIIDKDEMTKMVTGFVGDYTEGGWLPRWLAIGEHGCMPSTMIDTVILEAGAKGLIDKDTLKKGYEGMIHHSVHNAEKDCFGRSGAEAYCKYGYVPYEVHRESVNLTLDAAYGDWCIAEIAKMLGDDENEKIYRQRALNYRNLFDKETGFMRAKNFDGEFRKDFLAERWGLDYTEGSAWQSSFAVQHDIEGLASLYGGKDKLIEKVDELFATPPVYTVDGYGCEIHEMTEMAAADFGQCAISNQPSFHIPYIYSALGDVEKTSKWVEKLCTAFSWKDDGFPGDEDNGSMAAWYIFSLIGFYPFCPGKTEYVRTKRIADSVKICGKAFDADSFEGNTIPYSAFL